MKKLDFHSVVYKERQYFVAQCLDVDVSSFGQFEKEALDNLQEALELYFEDQAIGDIKLSQDPKLHILHLQNA